MQILSNSLPAHRLAALLLLCATATAAWAGPLVIRATGPSSALFKLGQRLGDAPVALKKGDLVVVLDKQGTRSFVGPGVLDTKAPGKPAEDRYDFSDITQPDGTRAVIAATRQMVLVPSVDRAEPAFNPVPDERIWTIVLAEKGPHCLVAGKPVTVVRSVTAKPATLDIVRNDDKKLVLVFAAGQKAQAAPARFFAAAGPYTITMAGKDQAVAIRLLPQFKGNDRLEALETIAQGLAAAGCRRQFALLADQIAPKRL